MRQQETQILVSAADLEMAAKATMAQIDSERRDLKDAILAREGTPHATLMNALRTSLRLKPTLWSKDQIVEIYEEDLEDAAMHRSFDRKVSRDLARMARENAGRMIHVDPLDLKIVAQNLQRNRIAQAA